MNRVLRYALPLLASMLLTACATTQTWSLVDTAAATAPDKSFTAVLPVGWVRAVAVKDSVFITRDGAGIQFIELIKLSGDKAFPTIKQTTTGGMLPAELAELQIAEYKSREGLMGLEILENVPAKVSGENGFRLHTRFRNSSGLRYDSITYGIVSGDNYYMLTYQAPKLHYFDRDLATFEEVVRSFRATPTKDI